MVLDLVEQLEGRVAAKLGLTLPQDIQILMEDFEVSFKFGFVQW
jgi:hypothetical protein